jgi:Carboxypeptidase regulatory-like domain
MVHNNKINGLDFPDNSFYFLGNSFERNLYFRSKLLTVEGFEKEQKYFIGKHQLINHLVHGQGILYGLNVTEISSPDKIGQISIKLSAGSALDCFGRVILVPNLNDLQPVDNTYQAEKPNYLYLEYDKVLSNTATALVEDNNCESDCTKDYIKETYKLSISSTPPSGLISGKVITVDKSEAISGAKIEAKDSNQIVKAVTFTNEAGEYNLFISAGDYTLHVSALSFGNGETINITVSNSIEPITDKNFSLSAISSGSQYQTCQELAQAYFTDYLLFPSDNNDTKIFIAALKVGTTEVDEVATKQYRSIVYNNPMLHQLLCDHLADFNNPHRTTADQVIDLVSPDNTIGIKPLEDKKTIELISNIRVDPGNDTKSVNTTIEPGDSSKLAREDHVHNLADKVVTSEKINDDAVTRETHLNSDITGLITSSNKSILFEPNVDVKTIDLSTNIATGIIKFSDITPGLFNVSGQIKPFQPPLPMKGVAIVMAISGLPETNSLIFMGELENGIPSFTLPLLTAIYQPEQDFFNIFLKDSRQPGDGEVGQSIDWKVHWWAIPAAKSGAEVTVPPPNENFQIIANDPLLLRIAMQPGITRKQLLAEGISTEQLNSLQTNELINVEGTGINRKYFIKAEN